mgnify:CR=1 FL=1
MLTTSRQFRAERLQNRKCLHSSNFCDFEHFWLIAKIDHTNISLFYFFSIHQLQEMEKYFFSQNFTMRDQKRRTIFAKNSCFTVFTGTHVHSDSSVAVYDE